MVIEPVTSRDAGVYTCIASNRAGQNSFNLELIVAGIFFFSPTLLLQALLILHKNRCEHLYTQQTICHLFSAKMSLITKFLMLFVTAKEMHKAPSFIEKLQNTSVAEGHPVRLECRVSGVPFPQIFWKKENESITHNTDRIRYFTIITQPLLTELKQFH